MDTKRIWPEITISGFFHLAAAYFLFVALMNKDPSFIADRLFADPQWTAFNIAALSAAILGGSFLMGALANRLLIDLSRLVARILGLDKDPAIPSEESLVTILRVNPDSLVKALEDRSAAKAFFRSMAAGMLLVFSFSSPWWSHNEPEGLAISTTLLFSLVEISLIIAFFTQRQDLRRLQIEMSKRTRWRTGAP